MWPEVVWEYSLYHGEEQELKELLCTWPKLLARLGPVVDTPIVKKEPEAMGFENKEYYPLVNPRTHELGGKRAVLNKDLSEQWRALLGVMAHR